MWNKSGSGRQTERILQSYLWYDASGIEYDQKRRKNLKILIKEETAKDIVYTLHSVYINKKGRGSMF